MTEPWKQWEGRVLADRFRLSQLLAGYAYAAVFVAEIAGGQKAAVKIVTLDPADVPEQLSRWEAAEKLPFPHLVRVLGMGRCGPGDSGLLFLATEFAEEDLSQVLPERPLTAEETTAMIDPVLEALAYIHARGLMHGHVKPSNVLAINGKLKLSVDGLCPAGKSESDAHDPGVYEAPEVSEGLILPAADVWSVGVVLMEALTQRLPVWDAAGDVVVPDSIPAPFPEMVRACLDRDPRKRTTIAALQARLKPVLAAAAPDLPAPTPAPPPAPIEPPALLSEKRSRTPLILMILVAVAVLGFILLRQCAGEPPAPAPVTEPPPAAAAPAAETPPAPAPAVAVRSTPPAVAEQPEPPAYAAGEVIERAMPDVPRPAQRSIRGTVTVAVRVDVDPAGSVTDAEYESHGPSRYFAVRALAAARRWRFSPATMNGHEVPSAWILRFEFRNDGTDVVPQRVKVRR